MGKSTALMDAAAAGSDAIVKLLLAAGADPHAWDADHRDALMHAAKRGHERVRPAADPRGSERAEGHRPSVDQASRAAAHRGGSDM